MKLNITIPVFVFLLFSAVG